MSVKITLGDKLQKNQMAQDELNARLMELTDNLSRANEEIINLNKEILTLQSTNLELEQKISEILNLNSNLNKKLELAKRNHIETESKNLDLKNFNEDVTKTNKLLKSEIEKLNLELNMKNETISNYSKEIEDVYKVKDKFEYKMIQFSEENEKLKENLKIYENIVRNKEKYIEILIRKNSGGNTIINTNDKIKNEKGKDNKEKIKNKNSNEAHLNYHTGSNFNVTSVTNVIVLQNKIFELEEKLSIKDEQIKKIEIEKANLLTRIRNMSIK